MLLNLLPARWFSRASGYVQGTLFAGFVLAMLRSWSIKDWNPAAVARLPEFAWLPPVWFAGLHEAILGDRDPFLAAMARRALAGLGLAVALAAMGYVLSYARYRRLLLEAPDRVSPPRRFRWSVLHLLARDPRERAVIDFMAKTLARSRPHRMIWLAYIGFAVAVVLNSSIIDGALVARKGQSAFSQAWKDAVQFLVLFWPLSCSAVLLPGIKHVLPHPGGAAGQLDLPPERIARAAVLDDGGDRFVPGLCGGADFSAGGPGSHLCPLAGRSRSVELLQLCHSLAISSSL